MKMGRKSAKDFEQAIHWQSNGSFHIRARPGLGFFRRVSFPGKTAENCRSTGDAPAGTRFHHGLMPAQ
jgi:hypothetical protein